MLKPTVIMWILKAIMWCVAIGIGIWYLSHSIAGTSITYISMPGFLNAIGACKDGVCDIAMANGCFLCPFVEQLFVTIGIAAEDFWNALVSNIWIIMAAGFGIFLFVTTFKHIREASAKNAELSKDERSLDFAGWFDKVWRTGIRIMVAGAILGAIGFGGHRAIKAVSDVTITPVMYLGSELAMAATGISDSAKCGSLQNEQSINENAIGPALRPFMCVVGNLNTVVLAGAAGGFSLMNYSWMGLGGGMFTWIAGLALLVIFLYIGFRIFFEILTVIFQLVFLIIVLPLIISAWAFENTWDIAKGVVTRAIDMLCNCAIRVISISLRTLIMYAIIAFAADEFFPGPIDQYSAIMPPGIAMNFGANDVAKNNDVTASVANVFLKCEQVATATAADGITNIDKDLFKDCFVIEKASVETKHPGAFDFMGDGFMFLMIMIGLFLVYEYVIKKEVESILGKGEDGKFEFGKYVREFGESLWNIPKKIGESVTKGMKK